MDIFRGVRAVFAFFAPPEWPAQRIYCSFFLGEINADGVYRYLQEKQTEDFLRIHREVRSSVELCDGRLPVEVLFQLGGMLSANPRRFTFVLAQVDALIDRDVERNVFKNRKPTLKHEF